MVAIFHSLIRVHLRSAICFSSCLVYLYKFCQTHWEQFCSENQAIQVSGKTKTGYGIITPFDYLN